MAQGEVAVPGDVLVWHRLQFAFTITFHYLFPQITMGLALLAFILATQALWTKRAEYWHASNFVVKILAIGFAAGVATGLPMEFQFGTNWAGFSRYSGSIIGQTLALEGVFAFFAESIFLGLLLFRGNLNPFRRWFYITAVFLSVWISGYFIIATNAWMQHPVGYTRASDGSFELASLGAVLLNPWLGWQYVHNMSGAVITGAFFLMGVGAFYLLAEKHQEYGRRFIRLGVIVGLIASVLQLYPSGDHQGQNVAKYQPVTLAAFEGHFDTRKAAPMAILGQPNMGTLQLDNPIQIPKVLSFLTWRRWDAPVQGLKEFSPELWPDHIPLVYYSYHIMVGLGMIFIGVMVIVAYALWWGVLFRCRPLLWMLLIASLFPFVANTAGWLTAELGRQPWLVYGLLRTKDGVSPAVSGGDTVFTLIGFMGAYLLVGLLVLFLSGYEIAKGPEPRPSSA